MNNKKAVKQNTQRNIRIHTSLDLYKQNFKFSAAHFLIFDQKRAEGLHGHNYKVRVQVEASVDFDLEEQGFFIDFNILKKIIRKKLRNWNEKVLLPERRKDMIFTEKGSSVEVRFRERFYVFPKKEVELLPINNTSVEQMSRLLAEDFFKKFQKYGVKKIQISVEETEGQAANTIYEKNDLEKDFKES